MLRLLAQSSTNSANQNIGFLNNPEANLLKFPNNSNSYPFKYEDFLNEELIFSHQQSIVEKYLHRPSGRELAIKFIKIHYYQHQTAQNSDKLKELQREIEIHQKVATRSSIVSFYGFCIFGGHILICMELMDMSLRDFYLWLHHAKIAISEEVLWHIIVSVIKALKVCKEKSVMHRDIKPLNILMNSRGEIKLCDFGASRILDDSMASSLVGTVAYWPIERIINIGSRYDFGTEIWSLGITILEFIMGKLPYSQNEIDINQISNLIEKYKFTGDKILEAYSENLKSFIESCLKPVSERPKLEMLFDMETYKRHENGLLSEEYYELVKRAIESKNSSKHFRAKMDKFGIEFAQDIIRELQLHNFLTKDNKKIFILVTEYNKLSAIKLSQVLQGTTEYKEDDSYIFIRFNSLLQECVIEALKSESNNLLIIECEEDKSIEEKDLQEIQRQLSQIINANIAKKIVLITKQDNALADLFKKYHTYQETTDNKNSFTHLTIASQNKLLQECKIIFQGREISLNTLIDENSKELIDSTTLVKLINNDQVTIGHKLISLDGTPNYYIPRTFNYQRVIKTEIFKEDRRKSKEEKEKYLLAISDIDEARLRRLVPEDHKISLFQEYDLHKSNEIKSVILNNGQAAEQFKQLCQRYPALNIHWLKSESDQLIWQQSQGSISGLRQYIDESHTKYYSETELLSQTDKVMIISDTAGMGKTTVLTSLSQLFKQQAPDLWIVRIDLSNFTKELQEQKVKSSFKAEDIDKAIAFLSNDILKLGTPLEQTIFKSYYEKMIVMLDGFDEISSDYRDIVIDLVNVLRNSTIKQLWVTTRPNERDILEDKLQQLSYKLEPFSKPNQVDFLTKFWQQTSGLSEVTQEQQERLKDYAGALIDLLIKSIRYKDTELTGVPLQTRMLAEAFEKDFAELFKAKESKLQLPEKLDLTDLYECFFKKKYDIQLEKSKLDISQQKIRSEIVYSKFIEKHQDLALYTLFPEDKVEMLLSEKFYQEFSKEYPDLAKNVLHDENNKQLLFKNKKQTLLSFIDDIKEGKANSGIIDQIIEDKPHFIHRTFAEYLVGKFLVDSLDNETIVEFVLQETLMQPAYQVTRAFLNAQLPEFLPENALARYGKQIERLWQSDKKNLYNKKGMALLHLAAEEGAVKIIRFLLNSLKGHETILKSLVKGTTISERYFNYYSTRTRTALHFAAIGGYLDVVQCMVEHGADVNATDNDGMKVLHYAAQKNKLDVVQWLVEHGADVNATGNYGKTVLHYAAQKNKLDVVQWLVEHGADVNATGNYGKTVLHYAAQENKLDVVQWLVEHGADVNATDNYGRTVLHYAAEENKWDVVQWLVEHGADVNATDNYGMKVLHYAAQENKWDVVQCLVEHGADVNATDNYGMKVLHYAAQENKLDVVQWLVEHGADVNATNKDAMKVLHYAAQKNKLDVVQWLVEHGADVNATNKDGRTVLHYAAQKNKLDVVQWLVEHGADVNATNKDGMMVLHYAAQENKLDVVQWLVEHGADVNATNKDGRTVLHYAAQKNKLDVVQWLVEHGADVNATNKDGRTVLHYAAQWNKLDVVQWLVEHGADVNATNKDGMTMLHYAAQWNKLDVVQWLVEHGKANVEATDNDGMTVLHYAAQENKLDVVQWLVEHGADVNATNKYGIKGLHYASQKNKLDVVQWLMEHGAAVNATNKDGITAGFLNEIVQFKFPMAKFK